MEPAAAGEITRQLARWAGGDSAALDNLAPIIYSELHKIAEGHLRRLRGPQILQPTALVNEAWMKLAAQESEEFDFENRQRFFALAAHIMRQVLVDYARSAHAAKRGGGALPVTLPESLAATGSSLVDLLALDEALERLAGFSPRQAQIIELRYFGGLNVEEASRLLNVSPATISREQRSAEAWLYRAMSSPGRPGCAA